MLDQYGRIGIWCLEFGIYKLMKRHINIKGAVNFRDIGGYPTKDGKTVKWRTLFRSGLLSGIDPTEMEQMKKLRLKTICDFRTNAEQAANPDRWHQLDQLQRFSLPIGEGRVDKLDWMEKVASQEVTKNYLARANKSYVLAEIPTYRTFFEILLKESHYPLLYHCTAGKDRTGFATFLLLSALGVDRSIIIKDYLLTNQYIGDFAEKNASRMAQELGISKEQIMPIFQVHTHYIPVSYTHLTLPTTPYV